MSSLSATVWAWNEDCPPLAKLTLLALSAVTGMGDVSLTDAQIDRLAAITGLSSPEVIEQVALLLDLGLVQMIRPGTLWINYEPPPGYFQSDSPSPGRAAIAKRTRAAVLARDGYACRTCGATERLQLDHIVPWSRGGADDEENLQTLCQPCNIRKGARLS